MENLLSILIFIPLLAALILAIFLRGDDEAAQRNAKWLALTATGASFFVTLILLASFDDANRGFQYVEERIWPMGLTYKVGVDGIALPFVMTIAALGPLLVGASWHLEERVRDYIIALLAGQTLLFGAVLALDLAFFVLFFEAALIPFFIMAGLWGKKGAGEPALKAVLYAIPGALLLVLAAALMAGEVGTTDMEALLRHDVPSQTRPVLGIDLTGGTQMAIWLALIWTLLVKAPLWPLNAWLPDLVAKAPPAVSIAVAGMGTLLATYIVVRLALPVLPVATEILAPVAFILVAFTTILGALAAMAQEHMRRHLGLFAVAMAGLPLLAATTGTLQGIDGAFLFVAAQALLLAGLFMLLAVLERRLRTDELAMMGGVRLRRPFMALLLLLFAFAAFGLPGTGAFVGLYLTVVAAFDATPWAGMLVAALIVPLGAAAMNLYRRIALGDAMRESVRTLAALDRAEGTAIGLAAAGLILLGLFPSILTGSAAPAAEALAAQVEAAQQD